MESHTNQFIQQLLLINNNKPTSSRNIVQNPSLPRRFPASIHLPPRFLFVQINTRDRPPSGGWLFGFFTGVPSQEKYIVPMAPSHYFNGVFFIAYATYPWLRHTLFLFRETLYDLLGWKGHRWLDINCRLATPPWPSLPLFLYIVKWPTSGPTCVSWVGSFHVSSSNLNYSFAFAFGYFCWSSHEVCSAAQIAW